MVGNQNEARKFVGNDLRDKALHMVVILFSRIGALGTKGDDLHKRILEMDVTNS